MTNEEAAYLAGLIDGEGSIGIFLNKAPTRSNYAVLCRIKIGMCDEPLVRWLQKMTGDGNVTSWRGNHEKWRRVYVVTWNGYAAADLIPQVLPYLRLKHRQAKLVLAWVKISKRWRAKVGGRSRGDRKYPDHVWRTAERIGARIRALNQTGTPSKLD